MTEIANRRDAAGIDEVALAEAVAQSEAEHAAGHHHHHSSDDFHDYTQAVRAYKQTFATKQDQIEQTPDPAVREMLLRMQEVGIDTVFDRFERQQPQCSFGIAGICCKNCFMGPCKITKKAPRGVCGADADLIVARNMLRSLAAGAAAHGARGRESMLALKRAGAGAIDLPILGESKIRAVCGKYGIDTAGKTLDELAVEVADTLLDDLSRTVPAPHKTLQAFAPPERLHTWEELDILPISVYHEVFESLHATSVGTDGDWRHVMQQFLRTGVAFAWTSCLGSSIAMDSLFGAPVRRTTQVNLGALRRGWVNIAVHGHSPLMVSEIVRVGRSPEYQQRARDIGAEGIQFYGICCSGLSAMYRYGGVIPLSNAVGAELVLGTGALDLWVADVQDVFPSIMDVAKCFKTTVVTTSDSARLPGAEHYDFDHHHANIDQIHELAVKIVNRSLESHAARTGVPVCIPQYETEVELGFSAEFAAQRFGFDAIAQALADGRIRGIVNLVGCNNPRLVYEKAIVEVCDYLIAHDVLVMTNGCASFPLMKLGYCSTKALDRTGEGLRSFLGGDVPPVWQMGECLDNARASALFSGVAQAAERPIKELPFAFSSPEWSNEKGICAALAFRLLGMNSYHSVHAPVQGSAKVQEFMERGTKPLLGSEMIVDVDHGALARRIVADMDERRAALGWEVVGR